MWLHATAHPREGKRAHAFVGYLANKIFVQITRPILEGRRNKGSGSETAIPDLSVRSQGGALHFLSAYSLDAEHDLRHLHI
jgi:hypothetical protein